MSDLNKMRLPGTPDDTAQSLPGVPEPSTPTSTNDWVVSPREALPAKHRRVTRAKQTQAGGSASAAMTTPTENTQRRAAAVFDASVTVARAAPDAVLVRDPQANVIGVQKQISALAKRIVTIQKKSNALSRSITRLNSEILNSKPGVKATVIAQKKAELTQLKGSIDRLDKQAKENSKKMGVLSKELRLVGRLREQMQSGRFDIDWLSMNKGALQEKKERLTQFLTPEEADTLNVLFNVLSRCDEIQLVVIKMAMAHFGKMKKEEVTAESVAQFFESLEVLTLGRAVDIPAGFGPGTYIGKALINGFNLLELALGAEKASKQNFPPQLFAHWLIVSHTPESGILRIEQAEEIAAKFAKMFNEEDFTTVVNMIKTDPVTYKGVLMEDGYANLIRALAIPKQPDELGI